MTDDWYGNLVFPDKPISKKAVARGVKSLTGKSKPKVGMFANGVVPEGLSAPPETLDSRLTGWARNAMQSLGVDGRTASRLANKITGALDFTPAGDVFEADRARQSWQQGNYLGALGHGAMAAVGAVPGAGDAAAKFIGKGVAKLPANEGGDIPDAITSLANFMRDPRPLRQMYDVGDVLMVGDEVGSVVSATDSALVIDLPSGRRIVPRTTPNLTPAPPDRW